MTKDYIVELKAVSKRFGSVQALERVNLELRSGEILGLVGDNAAGKSTLIKTLYGTIRPDEGEILVKGKKVTIRNPLEAQALGIGMVYQDLALFNCLDVSSNVFAGRERTRRVLGLRFLDRKRMHKEAAELLRGLNIDISSPKLLVEKLSGGQRQMTAVARAVAFEYDILLMDEPTAALGVREANTVLELIQELRAQGLSIILITQRMPDVLAIGDRAMVLKQGRRQGVLEMCKCTLDDLVTLVVRGREERNQTMADQTAQGTGE
jgi:simple sugar transport system ATP-binding protein